MRVERGIRARIAATAVACVSGICPGSPAEGQWDSGPSLLQLLPVTSTVQVGAEVEGELTATDYVSGGHRVRGYRLEGTRGSPITIDMVSEDFDSYLHLIGPDGTEIETDDDSGGACHARVSLFLPADGSYLIVAASLSASTGSFTLSTGTQQRPPASGECGAGGFEDEVLAHLASIQPQGSIGPGQDVQSSLGPGDPEMTDGSYVEAYTLTGEPGRTVFVDLVSGAFDALLFAVLPDEASYVSDDDTGGACNSRLRLTLEAEPHLLVVNSLSVEGTGSFTLRVSEMAGPEATGPCPGLGAR